MIETLVWTERLLAFSILLQTIEFLQIRSRITAIWDWRLLRREFVGVFGPLTPIFDCALSNSGFTFILLGQLAFVLAWLVFPLSGAVLAVFVTSLLICLRFRGVFNGGADSMTMILLLATSLAFLFPRWQAACLWLIAIQLILSYFLAGVAKLKSAEWRRGNALSEILLYSNSDVPKEIRALVRKQPALFRFAGWGVILFECLFPLALLGRFPCEIFLMLALLFHLLNVRVFGLNRFLWAWLAAYPALLFCSFA